MERPPPKKETHPAAGFLYSRISGFIQPHPPPIVPIARFFSPEVRSTSFRHRELRQAAADGFHLCVVSISTATALVVRAVVVVVFARSARRS